MARNYQDIKSYIEALLQDDLPQVTREKQHLAYGYPGERSVYEDPVLNGKQVVVVNNQAYGLGQTGQPNAIQEAYNYIDNLAAATKSLINDDDTGYKELRRIAIDKIAERFKGKITRNIDAEKATGDLFLSKKNSANKNFLKELKKATNILSLFTQAVGKCSGHSLKELEQQGHQLRSKNRDTLIHRFKAPNAQEGEEQFIIYIPCGRYTKRQQFLMNKADSVHRDHDTTSHNRANMVLGNSSMARMVAGTRHADGRVTIHHDSFTGPGARMPYSDFKGANGYKKLAIKAVTLINQEEIIQTLAQRQIDRLSNDELRQNIPVEHLPQDEDLSRRQLIELYLIHNPLAVTECYTQVVTAGQKISAENQKEQFKYVRQMMDAFDGEGALVSIQTDEDSEVDVAVSYQARMGSWGVNWFRQVGALNPLSDNNITKSQNTRFINEMTTGAIESLDKTKGNLGDFSEVETFFNLIKGPNVQPEEQRILLFKNYAHKKGIKSDYRQALLDYFQEYKKGKSAWNRELLNELKGRVENLETTLQRLTNSIYRQHRRIEANREAYFEQNKDRIQAALIRLHDQIQPALLREETPPEIRANLQHFYNTCAYLLQSQTLYYEETWHTKENNFKLQTLMATLAEELDYANTKGCKSNNDRGQRLAQKVVGNALWTQMSNDGLYTGEFLDQERTHSTNVDDVELLDRELTTIQTLHHTANTGVSGGKFEVNKESFADNGLFGKIASLAKIKEMEPDNSITKTIKSKLGLAVGLGSGVVAALFVVALAFLVPPVGLFLGTSLALAGFATLIGVAAMVGSFLTVSAIQSKLHDNKINGYAAEGMRNAQNELQDPDQHLRGHNNILLHLSLGVSEPTSPNSENQSRDDFRCPEREPQIPELPSVDEDADLTLFPDSEQPKAFV